MVNLSMPFPKTVAVTALLLGASVLSACGGVTVEGNTGSSETSTSIARESSTEEMTATEETSRSSSSNGGGSEPAPRDQPAAEVSELPEDSPERTPQELDFLDGLKEGGIDVDGVEDQLIATASTVCRAQEDGVENFTLDAIAGQLITQGRTEVPEERAVEVSELIQETAERTYC